jgi:hypothetical protein
MVSLEFFSLTQSFWSHCGPGVDSASNRNEYQEYFLACKGGRCVGLTNLPPSCVDCLEIWEPQHPGTLWACPGPVMGLLYLLFILAECVLSFVTTTQQSFENIPHSCQ